LPILSWWLRAMVVLGSVLQDSVGIGKIALAANPSIFKNLEKFVEN
jgi:hypothetical protein